MRGGALRLFVGRWWTYQRERFPLAAHGLLIGVFSASAVCFSVLLRAKEGVPVRPPDAWALVTAFVCCLLLFVQLRIADEFKDFAEDMEFRPYRPVQRGLVSLRDLGVVFVLCAVVQLVVAWLRSPGLVVLLGAAWVYLGLMSREFFAGRWLRGRPVVYLWSHMFIMPLVDLVATGCDWAAEGSGRPGSAAGLGLFLCASYFNGIVIEVGRKIRSPADEERGVNTYSALWGMRRAALVWLAAVVATGLMAVAASWFIGAWRLVGVVAGVLAVVCIAVMAWAVRSAGPGAGKRFEAASAVWTVGVYLAVGVVPMVVRVLSG